MAVFETEGVEVAAKKRVMLKKHRNTWWEPEKHPLTDAEFVEAFCRHVLLSTTDHSLVTLRNKAFRFIRNFMAPDLEAQLTKYREDYP